MFKELLRLTRILTYPDLGLSARRLFVAPRMIPSTPLRLGGFFVGGHVVQYAEFVRLQIRRTSVSRGKGFTSFAYGVTTAIGSVVSNDNHTFP